MSYKSCALCGGKLNTDVHDRAEAFAFVEFEFPNHVNIVKEVCGHCYVLSASEFLAAIAASARPLPGCKIRVIAEAWDQFQFHNKQIDFATAEAAGIDLDAGADIPTRH